MPSKQLKEASEKLEQAHRDLQETHRGIRYKGPKNEFARAGYFKYTTFAMNTRLRFRPRQRPGLTKGFSFNSLKLPFSEFNDSRLTINDTEFGSYLDEVELWSGQRGDYIATSQTMIEEFKNSLMNSTHTHSIGLKIKPKELLLVFLSGKLNAQANSSLISFREHYRYPDDVTSIIHVIKMFPLKLLLTPRDFLLLATHYQDTDGTLYYVTQSLNHLLPESKGCVRGLDKMSGFKIETTSNGCKVTFQTQIDVSVWLPRVSIEEYLVQSTLEYLKFCEAVILQLKRTPSRLHRLNNDFLKHLKSVEFNLAIKDIEPLEEEEETEVEKLKKIEQDLDEQIALYESDDNESSNVDFTTDLSDTEDEYDDDELTITSDDLLSLEDDDVDSDLSSIYSE